MTDLQKQIEELRNTFSEMDNLTDEGEEFDLGELWKVAREALSIIKQLQKERDTYKISWESDSEASKVIIEELKNENKAYIECLRRINSCDDSATQQSKEVHQVLRQILKRYCELKNPQLPRPKTTRNHQRILQQNRQKQKPNF